MSENVVNMPGRGNIDDPGFQSALRVWRRIAHRRGLVVGSPVRLIGAERTFFGDSDDAQFGPKDYKLQKPGGLNVVLEGIGLSKNEKEALELIYDELDERSAFDIKDIRAPLVSGDSVPELEDERGRWDIWLTDKQKIGVVVRVGEGARKHYLLYIWYAGWHLVRGAPCFDLPVFGLPELRARPDAPVMIHEGPKAMMGAIEKTEMGATGSLQNWMSLYVHIAWHGSDLGMEWTDWSVLRGRRILIWSDMDEAGVANGQRLAKKLSKMGMVVDYISWSVGDMERSPTWDWADDFNAHIRSLTRAELRARMRRVESPTGPDGRVLKDWATRTFLDMERMEVYQESTGFRPVPISSLAIGEAKDFKAQVVDSPIHPFRGLEFRPGLPFGRLHDGKINICPPSVREPCEPGQLERGVYRDLRVWLKTMVPDLHQRKHLLKRAAWSLAMPQELSRHMIVLQGASGIGKSVFLDTLVAVAGLDRAASLFPNAIMSRFNAQIAGKSIVCIHEIHSDDLTRRQNAARLKELIANETIDIEEKNRPKYSVKNVIHWFAATNEEAPFAMNHGNDRFYFVKCATPQGKMVGKMRRFFNYWVPNYFEDPLFQDILYAAAKSLVRSMSQETKDRMTGRARRQAEWAELEIASMRPWEQALFERLQDITEVAQEDRHPPVFVLQDIIRVINRDYRHAGVFDIQTRTKHLGYCALSRPDGTRAQRRFGKEGRMVLWCRKADLADLKRLHAAAGGYEGLSVRRLGEGVGEGP